MLTTSSASYFANFSPSYSIEHLPLRQNMEQYILTCLLLKTKILPHDQRPFQHVQPENDKRLRAKYTRHFQNNPRAKISCTNMTSSLHNQAYEPQTPLVRNLLLSLQLQHSESSRTLWRGFHPIEDADIFKVLNFHGGSPVNSICYHIVFIPPLCGPHAQLKVIQRSC